MALVTVSTLTNAQDAELARLALEAEGIPCLIADEVRVQVEEDDLDAADTVLNRLTGVTGAEYATPSDARPAQPPQECPNCGAADIARRQKLTAFAIFSASVAAMAWVEDATMLGFFIVAAGAVFFLVAARWRCRQCGETW